MPSIIDITLPLAENMLTFEGDPLFDRTLLSMVDPDDPSSLTLSLLSMGSHAGTHVDAPAHFVEGGASADQLALEVLCGPARVVDLCGIGTIEPADLQRLDLQRVERLLLRTDNSARLDRPFSRDYVGLAADAARWLVEHTRVRLVGIDYLSIEPYHCPFFPVHHALLEAGVVIVEGLDLRAAHAGDYELWCLPLRIMGGDGAPARAVLVKS